MRSDRSPSAGIARQTTTGIDGVVKTFFGWAAATEHGTTAASGSGLPGRPAREYPLASGEGDR